MCILQLMHLTCLDSCVPSFVSVIEGLRERTEHLNIFLFSAHHSMVICFWCSIYWWKSVRVSDFSVLKVIFSRTKQIPLFG